MSRREDDNYRTREKDEARYGVRLVWKCDRCGHSREDYPGTNEGGRCSCGGSYEGDGETCLGEPLW